MEKAKGLADRVEMWAAKIPGIRTYMARENRRETDKKLRELLATRLQEVRSRLKRVTLELSQTGRFGPLAELDRLSSHLQQMADTIGHASYGYSGIFDLEKVREEELDRLYAFDLALVEDLEGIEVKVKAWTPETAPEALKTRIQEAEDLVDSLEQKFRRRGEHLKNPAG